ncbi:MAG: YkvA family protein [Candidatus Kapaibacterium sp.]
MQNIDNEFSEKSFWNKLTRFARNAGRELIERALALYFTLKDEDTPKWAKTVIVGALGYFILPTDAIPDLTPLVGFSDDLGAIVSAFAIVAAHVKQEHINKAQEKLQLWFG